MTGDKNLFVDMDEWVRSHVIFRNNSLSPSAKQMDGFYDTKSQKKLIHDVMYVPGVAQNLITLRQLMKRGHYVISYEDKCMAFHKNMEVIISVKITQNKWMVHTLGLILFFTRGPTVKFQSNEVKE